jgi:hypothetical protein
MTQKSTYQGVIMIRGKGTGFVAIPGFDEDILILPFRKPYPENAVKEKSSAYLSQNGKNSSAVLNLREKRIGSFLIIAASMSAFSFPTRQRPMKE